MPKRIIIDTLKNELIKLPLQDVLKLINEYSSATSLFNFKSTIYITSHFTN